MRADVHRGGGSVNPAAHAARRRREIGGRRPRGERRRRRGVDGADDRRAAREARRRCGYAPRDPVGEVLFPLSIAALALGTLGWPWAALAWDTRRLALVLDALRERGLDAAPPTGRGPFATAARAALEKARTLAAAEGAQADQVIDGAVEAFDLAIVSHRLAAGERALRVLLPLLLAVAAVRAGVAGDFLGAVVQAGGAYAAWAIFRSVPTFEQRVAKPRGRLVSCIAACLPPESDPREADEDRPPP